MSKKDKVVEPSIKEVVEEMSKDKDEIETITGKNYGYLYSITGDEYKYSPIPISKYGEFHELMTKFQNQDNVLASLLSGGDDAAKLILMGLKPNYPDMTIEKVKDSFDFAAYPRAIKLAINLNHFFAEMREIQELMG